MEFKELVKKRRTIRRFKQDSISIDTLKSLIEYARLAPSAANVQSLRYIIVKDSDVCQKIFPLVRWAANLPESERAPESERRPTAYVIVLNDTEIKKGAKYDIGAAVQNILLGATDEGLGACWMGSIERDKLRIEFSIPEKYEITHVISLGYPDEKSKIEPFKGSYKYWKDENGLMHVPKISVEELIFKIE
ncbi:MAG: NADPH-flavin oxidoreductase [Promethearchaeota archaeon]|jgi:nitroreductase|nr:MAG: NADPH-flavin oxidoreductase [Candidatus Lokiarchaeota archaeon]